MNRLFGAEENGQFPRPFLCFLRHKGGKSFSFFLALSIHTTMPLVSVPQRKDDGTPLLGLGEEMILALPDAVECHFDPSSPSEGAGSLYVTTKNVIWLSSSQVRDVLLLMIYFFNGGIT
jgi:hypothetical protein